MLLGSMEDPLEDLINKPPNRLRSKKKDHREKLCIGKESGEKINYFRSIRNVFTLRQRTKGE